jgi:hypothetical protein
MRTVCLCHPDTGGPGLVSRGLHRGARCRKDAIAQSIRAVRGSTLLPSNGATCWAHRNQAVLRDPKMVLLG